MVLAMSHLSRHVKYLQGTAHLVLKGFNENQCILDSRMEQTQAERLHFELKNLEISIQALQQDIEDIKKEVNLVSVDFRYWLIFCMHVIICIVASPSDKSKAPLLQYICYCTVATATYMLYTATQ